jgi:hypothetical protein
MTAARTLVSRFAVLPPVPAWLGLLARLIILPAAIGLAAPTAAAAQTLGTYRWQLQPYCNVLTVTVAQQGGQYTVDGTDDQCGGPQKASVRGMAFPNTLGTIGFGLTIVTAPGGAPVHVDAAILISTLSGVWEDSEGNSGTFIFTPGAGVGGSARSRPSRGGPRAAFVSGNQGVTLGAAPSVLRTLAMAIPAAGTVIVNTSGYFYFRSSGYDSGRCNITTGTNLEGSHDIFADDYLTYASQAYIPMAGTRGFAVSKGTFTVRLVCERLLGAISIHDTSLTALYVAQ